MSSEEMKVGPLASGAHAGEHWCMLRTHRLHPRIF